MSPFRPPPWMQFPSAPVMEGNIGVYRKPLGDGPIGEPPATASSVSTVRYIGRVGKNALETRVYGLETFT